MVKLYHYTDTMGKNAIEASRILKKSVRNDLRDDAQYGTGVYFTSITPDNRTDVILGNNYDGRSIPEHKKARTEWYFEFDSSELPGVEQVDQGKRDVWLLRGTDCRCLKRAGQRRL